MSWDDFDVEGKSLSDIRVQIFEPKEINLPLTDGKPSVTGTEIIIKEQRQAWSKINIENLFQELSALTPPFENVQDLEKKVKVIVKNKSEILFLKKKIKINVFQQSTCKKIILKHVST